MNQSPLSPEIQKKERCIYNNRRPNFRGEGRGAREFPGTRLDQDQTFRNAKQLSARVCAAILIAMALQSGSTLRLVAQESVPQAVVATSGVPNSFETIARELLTSTVTIQLQPNEDQDEQSSAHNRRHKSGLICTGILIRHQQHGKKIIAPAFYHLPTRIEGVLGDGRAIEGRTLVVDEYSGLCLLSVEGLDKNAPEGIRWEGPEAAAGSFVLCASPTSSRNRLVSLGIVSAHDQLRSTRYFTGVELPGLLACDIRTTRYPRGAGLVDSTGMLQGIIVARDKIDDGGWTYAIPARHIDRLLEVYDDRLIEPETGAEKENADTLLIRRQRPWMGVWLNDRDGRVRVIKASEDGPAFRAGIRKDDMIAMVNGNPATSVLGVMRRILSCQPGDELILTIETGSNKRSEKRIRLGTKQGSDATNNIVRLQDVHDLKLARAIRAGLIPETLHTKKNPDGSTEESTSPSQTNREHKSGATLTEPGVKIRSSNRDENREDSKDRTTIQRDLP